MDLLPELAVTMKWMIAGEGAGGIPTVPDSSNMTKDTLIEGT